MENTNLSAPQLSEFNVIKDEYLTVHLNAFQNLPCGGQEYTDDPENTHGWSVHIIKRHMETGIVPDIPDYDWDFMDKSLAKSWAMKLTTKLHAILEEY